MLKTYLSIAENKVWNLANHPEATAGCSKRPSSKAAASEEAKRTPCSTLSL